MVWINELIRPPKTLGILGGGQLARMLSLEAAKLGIKVLVLDPAGDEASAAIISQVIKGHFRDAKDIYDFSEKVDILTTEIEHVNIATLQHLEQKGTIYVQPSANSIAIIQDKFVQKNYFQQAGVSVGEFLNVPDEDALSLAAEKYSYPFMLKNKRLAYDGRGNFVVRAPDDFAVAVQKLGGFKQELYAEKWQKFSKELSIMVVKARNGEIKLYPVTETIQRNNICYITETPAIIPNSISIAAEKLAVEVVSLLDGCGVFGVEMFLMENGEILLNEVTPRVHNSGHYTMNGCTSSQFENHIRAIMDLPIGDTSLITNNVIMLNIIGEDDGENGLELSKKLVDRALSTPGCNVHWYNKSVLKGRKIGHINIIGKTTEEVRERLRLLEPNASTYLTSLPKPKVGIIMGSDSDLPTMKDAAIVFDQLGVAYEITLVSAHRTPDRLVEYARSSVERGLNCIIAGAGGAAHLPGMVASMTTLPVIGVAVVPKTAAYLQGKDALYSILQMPTGVPVATVAIGNATNAGLLAVRILAVFDDRLRQQLLIKQTEMNSNVLEKVKILEKEGWKNFLYSTTKTESASTQVLPQFSSIPSATSPTTFKDEHDESTKEIPGVVAKMRP